MHGLLLGFTLAGLAHAQLLDLETINASPPAFVAPSLDVASQSVTYSPVPTLAAAIASDEGASGIPAPTTTIAPPQRRRRGQPEKRDGTCASQPAGSGPVPTPDTVSAFLSDTTLQVCDDMA